MTDYDSLINAVKAAVKTNGTGAITGATLQTTLLGTIEELTAGFQFMGVATPETTPDSNDKKEFYLGFAGTYANFGSSVTVPEGSIILFKKNNGAWSSQVVKIVDPVSVSQNTNTGHTDITVGGNTTPVASIDDIEKVSGVIDRGTTYNEKDSTQRVCVYYPIKDKNALYHIKLSDVVLSDNANSVKLAIRSGKTPYSATVLANIGNGEYTGNVDLYFYIPDNVKESAEYIGVTQYTAEGTASFKVELSYQGTDVINTRINEASNNTSLIRVIGNGTTANLITLKTVVGNKYIVTFPKEWSANFGDGTTAIFMVTTDGTLAGVVDGTLITKSVLSSRNNQCEFIATETEYNMFVRADFGQQLLFIVSSVGEYDTLYDTIEKVNANSQKISYLDDGTTYNEKFGATQRTCAFIPIGDVDSEFTIELSDITIPSGNSIGIVIASAQSPYSAAVKYVLATISSSDDYKLTFSIPEAVKADAKYIGIKQNDADMALCEFTVTLYSSDCLQRKIDKINSELKEIDYIDKGDTYNEKFGTTQRTCVFYPLADLDKNKEFYIKLFNTTIPSSNSVRVIVTKGKSPYDTNPTGNVVQLIGELNVSGGEFEKVFALTDDAKANGNYIGVCQVLAGTSLCEFSVLLGYNDCINHKVDETYDILNDAVGITKDVIPYNDTVFANGRTLKIYNPYKKGGNNQYAGQLHCHSWNEESYNGQSYQVAIGYTVQQWAAMTAEERIAAQAEVDRQFAQAHKTVGYAFMSITNYDYSSALTHEPDVMPNDFLWFGDGYESNTGGWDDTGQAEDRGAHLGVLNANFCTKFRDWAPKDIVDYCEDRNCIVIYNHPFLSALYSSPAFVKQIKNRLRFIEVYNGLSAHHADLAPDVPFIKPGVELDEDFDALITQGNFCFAVAASDERILDTTQPDLRWGCIKVFADALTHKNIIESFLDGNFYCTSLLDDDVYINGVTIEDGKYSVNVGIEGIKVEFVGINNTILSTVTTSAGSTIADYQIVGNEQFVRARVSKVVNDVVEWTIWTQPMFIATEIL